MEPLGGKALSGSALCRSVYDTEATDLISNVIFGLKTLHIVAATPPNVAGTDSLPCDRSLISSMKADGRAAIEDNTLGGHTHTHTQEQELLILGMTEL